MTRGRGVAKPKVVASPVDTTLYDLMTAFRDTVELREKEINKLIALLKRVVTREQSEVHPKFQVEVWEKFKKENNINEDRYNV